MESVSIMIVDSGNDSNPIVMCCVSEYMLSVFPMKPGNFRGRK